MNPSDNQSDGVQYSGPVQPSAMPAVPHGDSAVTPAQSGATDDSYAQYVPAIDAPAIAEDVDLIEKEWVDKAKDIVERTKADPRSQSREISKLRADYLKKRYNRDVKAQRDD